jgi:VanZ family protein
VLYLQKKLKRIRPSFLPAIIWLLISTILLCLPGSAFPKETWLDKIWFDKWVHIGLFAIMVTLWCWAYSNKYLLKSKTRSLFILLALIWLVYGFVMELVQGQFIPNRDFELGDVGADAIGCFLGLLFSNQRFIKK